MRGVSENPLQPQHANVVAKPAVSRTHLIWRYPATLTLLTIAVVVSVAFTFVFGCAELALMAGTPTALLVMSLPGMIAGLIVGFATKSLIGEIVGYWFGMVAAYGLVGLVIDLVWQAISRVLFWLNGGPLFSRFRRQHAPQTLVNDVTRDVKRTNGVMP